MQNKKWLVFVVFLFLCLCLKPGTKENFQAATSKYTNAKEFYESTALKGEPYHSESWNGAVYYATYAKLASSSVGTKYSTVGFDITLSGNGHSVSFAVERYGQSVTLVNQVNSSGYQYDLYAVEDKELYRLAQAVEPLSASYVLAASKIHVQIDTIMITKKGNTPNGGITENGYGGISKWGTIYRLKNDSDLKALKNIFSGHYFESYKKIESNLDNPKLQVLYVANGTDEVNKNASSAVTVGNGFRVVNYTENGVKIPYVLYANGGLYKSSSRVLQAITLLKPSEAAMSKVGYHLKQDAEWITEEGKVLSANKSYMPKEIAPEVGFKDTNIYVYANWKPNKYTITYHANGGIGTMTATNATYDTAFDLKACAFSRTGYRFVGWSTSPEGVVVYTDKQQGLKNLTTVNEAEIKLYAVWLPDVCEITLDNDGADVPGTDTFYQKYEKGHYADMLCMIDITSITVPTKNGYTFCGYYDAKNGGGAGHIDASGKITAANTAFKQDRTIYAKWKANTYTIRYNGVNGTLADSPAMYDKSITLRPNVFTRRGYNFAGWARTDGGAVVYTDKETVKNITSVNGAVIDLYAVWEPITAQITLDPQEGSGGTGYFYEKFGVNFFTNNALIEILDKINIPSRTGYDFKGYFADIFGSGSALIGADGIFGIDSTYFVQDSTLFAKWVAKTYTLTLNKEGGTGGTSSVTVTYDKLVPGAEADVVPRIQPPTRYGFEFKGYYTEKNGNGTKFYNEFMYSDIVYKSTQDTPLFAYWVDNYAPAVSLSGNDKWTHDQTTIEASASDYGMGLKSLIIYRIGEDGSLTAVATANNLNGVQEKKLTFTNTTQGAVRYKAVAVDMNGNTSESYSTVYYDFVKPTGSLVQFTQNGNQFTIIVDVTDANTSN